MELAQDFSRASAAPVPSLGLYMRRTPTRLEDTFSFTETALLARFVHGGGPGPVWGDEDGGGLCVLFDQRSPNCLETAPEDQRDRCPQTAE